MASTAKLQKYIALRQTQINKMQELEDVSKKAETNAELYFSLFEMCFDEIDVIKHEFFECHNAIIGLVSEERDDHARDTAFSTQDTIRKKFDLQFYMIKSLFRKLTKVVPSLTNIESDFSSKIPLPHIELPTFSGDILTFQSYIDMFDSVIGNNPKLSKIEKFNYLLSSLKGPALQVVQNLPMTSSNYEIAYDTLVNRFQNKRVVASSYWSAIDNAPKLNSDNPAELRHLLDIFSDNLSALKNLKFPVGEWDFILVQMLLKRLDITVATQFEMHHNSTDIPLYRDVFDFLSKHCVALDNLNISRKNVRTKKPEHAKSGYNNLRSTTSLLSHRKINESKTKCIVCEEVDHQIYKCPMFSNLSALDRFKLAKNKNLCINCLSQSHSFRSCASTSKCRRCRQPHHTLLHFEKPSGTATTLITSTPSDSDESAAQVIRSESVPQVVHSGFSSSQSSILLSTAQIEVMDIRGGFQTLRCLLDSGSMTSFITQRSVRRLGLRPTNTYVSINGVGSTHTLATQGGITISFRPRHTTNPVLSVDTLVLPKICDDLPYSKLPVDNWIHTANLKLADPQFATPGPIDLLLGADIFSQVLLEGRISGGPGEPHAINTIFGFVLMGKFTMSRSTPTTSLVCLITNPSNLDETVKKFWEIEAVPEVTHISPEDLLCEKVYVDTTSRDKTGRFIVQLPFRESPPIFSDMRQLALQRFYSLEKRLLRQPALYEQYKAFMQEYLELDHMEPVEVASISNHYYIPHHPVLKPDSLSTKLRVVFNASAKLPTQPSLNDCLLTGQKLQQDVSFILLNFRLYSHVLTADIRMMYRQILISPEHRCYQRILWRFSPHDPIRDFALKTVVYGVSSAPFLALRTLLRLVEEDGHCYPLAAQALRTATYVDDIVVSVPSFEKALTLKNELIELLKKGGFELRKWSSNEPILLEDLPSTHQSLTPLSFDSSDATLKVLGLQWSPSADAFKFSVRIVDTGCTKRNILSNLARIFDPLGFLSPVTFLLKHLIQQIWTLKLGWDQEPPQEIIRVWNKYLTDLPLLSSFSLPRRLGLDQFSSCELHCFGDASEKGYSAVAYAVFFVSSGPPKVYFVCGKSKVAPLKRISVPRLELCAAVLAARLVAFIQKVYSGTLSFDSVSCWSDSKTALWWIQRSPHNWKTFVANRVAYIQERVPEDRWSYIPSNENPADIGSRGLLPGEFLQCSLWWAGPDILHSSPQPWVGDDEPPPEALEEERTVTLNASVNSPHLLDTILLKKSSLSVSCRIVAYIYRFIHNTSQPANKRSGCLTSQEIHQSILKFAKHVQTSCFSEELSLLANSKPLSKPLARLSPFIDDSGILRVGGRLRHAPISFDRKFPVLIPSISLFTDRLIETTHLKYFHAGVQTVQFLISQQFWIINSKKSIRRVLSRCIRCWKTRPRSTQPAMGDLPIARVSRMKSFLHAGVDFAGPFRMSMSRTRGAKILKAYLCLFVCMATKAVHLESVSDLSADAFLAALRRFVARRGRCEHLYSDCGTNFVSAHRQLNETFASSASQEGIVWHFNPPAAPNFGGLWESGVKSVKSHFVRVVGDQVLTFEELLTVFTRIESILNSRPLTPFSNDPNDLTALTPGHFLSLAPLTSLPDEDLREIPLNRLSRWQLVSRMHQDFWDRWSKEYLHTLHQRTKWASESTPLNVGTLVLIKADNVPPLKWHMGRVTATYPGADGKVRVASVKTATGILRRPVTKLCPLPLDS